MVTTLLRCADKEIAPLGVDCSHLMLATGNQQFLLLHRRESSSRVVSLDGCAIVPGDPQEFQCCASASGAAPLFQGCSEAHLSRVPAPKSACSPVRSVVRSSSSESSNRAFGELSVGRRLSVAVVQPTMGPRS